MEHAVLQPNTLAEPLPSGTPGALAGLRVIDMTRSCLQYCGKLFAQLGADVLLVEPVDGCDTRHQGPFLDDVPHAERSLAFGYFNQGKRGIAIDLASTEGRQLLRELARDADLLIESESPGTMTRHGLDHDSLSALNPKLVTVSITPFGQTGPYRDYVAEDIVALALGGLLHMAGDPDAAPVAACGNQAYLAGAQFGAVAAMSALLQVESGGSGQQLDVSIQECVSMALENAAQYVDLEGFVRSRNGSRQRQAGSGLFRCADGMVYLMADGIASTRSWDATVQWLIDEDTPEAQTLRDPVWKLPPFLASDEGKQRFETIFLAFSTRRTKAALYAEGQRRRIPICPLNTTADLQVNRQLGHRGFFQETLHPYTGRRIAVPGAPYLLTETPWRMGQPAPRLGEHTSAVLSELGHDQRVQAVWLRAGVIA